MNHRANTSGLAISSNSLKALAAHAILITYTLIALFPVAVILINSFKTRKAIFRSPLSLPDSESFSLVGYETVMQQGDFVLYFQNSPEIHTFSFIFKSLVNLIEFRWL